MAIHLSHTSMIKESLPEFVEVADYCINFRKDPKIWGSDGCYGYPANVLLLAIVDAIGSYVLGGSTRKHFDILNHSDYYNLKLDKESTKQIYEAYRCLGTHNAVLGKNVFLQIGHELDPVFINNGKVCILKLKPLLVLTKAVVEKFLSVANELVPAEVLKK